MNFGRIGYQTGSIKQTIVLQLCIKEIQAGGFCLETKYLNGYNWLIQHPVPGSRPHKNVNFLNRDIK